MLVNVGIQNATQAAIRAGRIEGTRFRLAPSAWKIDCLLIMRIPNGVCVQFIRAIHYSGVGSACMQHDLGDEFVNLFGRVVMVRSSLRNNYLICKGLWLLRQPWVSSVWKILDSQRLFLIYIVCSLFVGKRFQNWKMMTIGFWHGVASRMGPHK